MHFTVSDYLLDIVHNSIQAAATTVAVELATYRDEDGRRRIEARVADDGAGMSSAQLARAMDPFYSDGTKHRGRRVGLGLPFLEQAMDTVGGELSVTSTPGAGTTVRFGFDAGHVDAPPLGDVVGCFVACLAFDGEYEMTVDRRCGDASYELQRSELRDALGGFSDVSARSLLRQFIESAESETCTKDMEELHGKNEP